MSELDFLAIFSGSAVSIGLFISGYFLTVRSDERIKLLLISLLFLGISLRISKSVIYHFFGIPKFGIALGFAGLAIIGPLIWLYFKYYERTRINVAKELFHFIPAVFGFFSIWLNLESPIEAIYLYLGVTYLLVVYLIFCWSKFLNLTFKRENQKQWNTMLLLTLSIACFIFLVQNHTGSVMIYAIGTAAIGSILYIMFFFALKNPMLFPKAKPDASTNFDVLDKIKKAIEVDKVYLQPCLTLDQLAIKLKEPSYLISKTIRSQYDKAFPSFINDYRIENVINNLTINDEAQIKIESLAYTAGFNTPSAFYNAFKKYTGMSPTEYQKHVFKNNNQKNVVLKGIATIDIK
jgi:AraC-like DNA-binding protein